MKKNLFVKDILKTNNITLFFFNFSEIKVNTGFNLYAKKPLKFISYELKGFFRFLKLWWKPRSRFYPWHPPSLRYMMPPLKLN